VHGVLDRKSVLEKSPERFVVSAPSSPWRKGARHFCALEFTRKPLTSYFEKHQNPDYKPVTVSTAG